MYYCQNLDGGLLRAKVIKSRALAKTQELSMLSHTLTRTDIATNLNNTADPQDTELEYSTVLGQKSNS